MSLKLKVWTLVDIALRMPPIFIMDAVLKYGLGSLQKSDMDHMGHQYNLDVKLRNASESSVMNRWISSSMLEDIGLSFVSFLLYAQGKF